MAHNTRLRYLSRERMAVQEISSNPSEPSTPEGQKRIVTTAPDRIRKWSPTWLLTGRYPGYLRRSDGMRSFLGSMAVDTDKRFLST
jgi:hypothetical protein